VQVSILHPSATLHFTDANISAGTGCMAALEAEKYLEELEDLPTNHQDAKAGNL
jgi:thioredoxin reductase (NADPH)